jgi:hypothetical protein
MKCTLREYRFSTLATKSVTDKAEMNVAISASRQLYAKWDARCIQGLRSAGSTRLRAVA